jgi:hypothetical protein
MNKLFLSIKFLIFDLMIIIIIVRLKKRKTDNLPQFSTNKKESKF